MDLEQERERQRRSYRLCWFGFTLLAMASMVVGACSIGDLLLLLSTGRPARLGNRLGIPSFEILLDTFRTWARFVGSLSLWAAWVEPSWRRRAGLLVLISTTDVVLWGMLHGVALGLFSHPLEHEFFRGSLGMAMAWSRYILYAALAADFAQHVGFYRARDLGHAARATASSGAIVWFIYFVNQVDWRFSWPLVPGPMTKDTFLFLLTYWVISAICLVQASLLCLMASSSAARAVAQMRREDASLDPWASAAEPGRIAVSR